MRVGSLSLGLAPLSLLLSVSCSLVYDLSPDQCGTNDDCLNFGANFSCENGVCKAPENGTGGTGATGGSSGKGGTGGKATGGSSGKGGSSGTTATAGDSGDGGTGGSSGKGGTGGKASGGSSGKGGTGGSNPTAGEGGDAGATFEPECATHNECFEIYGDIDPIACVNQRCQKILNDDCPVLLPFSEEGSYEMLKSTDAIILGAYAPVPNSLVSIYTQNFDLVLDDFKNRNGIPVGSSRRHVVMVVCRWNPIGGQVDLLRSADHMIEDLGVKGIIGMLPSSADMQYVFEERGRDANVFFMMPGYSDESLSDSDETGLIWNELSGGTAMAASFQPLLDMTLEHLRNNGSLADPEPAKVFLIQSDDERFLDDYGTAIRQTITFNGKNAADNETDGNFFSRTNSAYTSNPDADQTDVIEAVLASAPHLVIASTADELFTDIIPAVESQWATRNPSQNPPFYIVSPFLYKLGSKTNALLTAHPTVRTRMLGTNWPAAVSAVLYNAYLSQFSTKYGTNTAGLENYYDAAYYLTYAVAAAPKPLTGDRIAEGMLRVTGGSVTYNVGRTDMNTALNWLKTDDDNRFQLIGAMGPPAWNSRGNRTDAASVWCLNSSNVEQADVLRYDAQSMDLTGTFPASCFTFPEPP